MNSVERVMAAINFMKPDRIPHWNVSHFGDFTKNWTEYLNINPGTNPSDYYGYDTYVCNGDESYFPSQKKKICDDMHYEILNDGWGRTIRNRKDGYFYETIDTILKNRSDLDKLNFEPASLDMRYVSMCSTLEKERAAGRCIFAKIGGIYIRSHHIYPEDELLMSMALDEGFCNELFDRVSQHFTEIALETLKRTNTWETGLFVYDDMASTYNTMFSPAMFEKYFLPRYSKMISTLREAGCKHFYLHSDGNIGPVIDLLIEAGFEGFNPIEPRSGLDLVKLREKYGKKIIFFGGVCNTEILPRGDKKEIEAHVRPLIELGREGGVILGMASAADDISPQAYDYYMSLVKKYGRYS